MSETPTPKAEALRVAAKRATPKKAVHAEIFTLGRRRAFMEQLESRRESAEQSETKKPDDAS